MASLTTNTRSKDGCQATRTARAGYARDSLLRACLSSSRLARLAGFHTQSQTAWRVPLSAFLLYAIAALFSVASALTSQTITFNALGGKTYGNAPFTVSATATSGLTVSFASLTTPVCTVSGTTVTVVAAGTCTIEASQAGNATYAAAPVVDRSFTVAKAAQTITFGALTGKTYGAAPFTVSATASSGLAVTFVSTTTAVCTVSASTVTIVTGGTCTIQAQQAGNGNYNAATNVSQGFTVAKATQTITFGALTGKTFGAAPFTVSATASSGLAVTFVSTTTAICTVSGTTVTIVTGGTCTIQAQQAGNTSYSAAANVNQGFTVAKAAQTITFGALSGQTYGAAPFTVSATSSSGLTVTFTSTTTSICTVSTATVTIVTGGTCTIRAAQAGNTSYLAATNVDRSFVIAKASQTISFGALSPQTYGVAPFTVSASASSGLAVTFTSTTTSVCTVSGNTVTLQIGGTCTIRAAQAGNTSYLAATNVDQGFVVSKASQSISFSPLSPQTYGALPFSVSASATSGLAVTFSSITTTVCTVSGSTVTIAAGGTCTVRAAQAGNGGYLAATNVDQSFLVSKANQTISFGALSPQTYGVAPFDVSANASSGLAIVFSSLTSTICTMSGTTVSVIAGGGTCTVQAAQPGDTGYNAATSVSQSFAVSKLAQTISFSAVPNQSITAGYAYLNASSSSGLSVAFTSTTPTTCTVASNVVTLVAPGNCTIQANQAGNTGYLAAPTVTQGFGISLLAQTITFDPITDHQVAEGYLYVNASASSNLQVTLTSLTTSTCTTGGTNPITLVAAGVCTLRATQAGNANYGAAATIDRSFNLALTDQTITFGVVAPQIAGGISVPLVASSSSFLPVVFSSLTPTTCTVSDSHVQPVAPGTCTLRAAQAGNAAYSPQLVDRSLAVLPSFQFGFNNPYANNNAGDVIVADLNGDGNLDIATTDTLTNKIVILLGTGNGVTFNTGTPVATGSGPTRLAIADFDGDGKIDLAVTDNVGDDVRVYHGNGNGTFTLSSTLVVQGPVAIVAGDFNGDGKADLVVTNGINYQGTGSTISVFFGNGNGTFQAATTYASGPAPQSIAAGDFDHDGILDLAVGNILNGAVTILLGSSSGTFTQGVLVVAHSYPTAIRVGDFNGDGNLDLAIANVSSGDVSVVLGHGDGSFGPPTNYPVGNVPSGLVLGDFNLDGTLDIAVANNQDSDFAILAGVGDGTFAGPQTFGNFAGPYAMAAGDLNGDGRPDLVIANNGTSYTTTVLNTSTAPGAASLSVVSGTPQSASFGSKFATPIAVLVKDAGGVPMRSVVVTWKVPTSGASGSFSQGTKITQVTTDASGTAVAPPLFANVTSGTFSLVASVGAINAAFSLTITGSQAPTITSSPPPGGTYGATYSFTVTGSGAPTPTFSVSAGALPSGLTLSAAGSISGTPNASGTYTGTIAAGNGVNPQATQPFSITIAALAQTINFAPIGSQSIAASPIAAYASATSGLGVTFTAITPTVCTVTGTTITLIAVGTCTIQAYQAGNFAYAGASSVPQSFSVVGATQTIAFGTLANRTLGSPAFTVDATATSGLAVSFASTTPAVCTTAGTTVTLVAAGFCTIRASQSGNSVFAAASTVDRSMQVTSGPAIQYFYDAAGNVIRIQYNPTP